MREGELRPDRVQVAEVDSNSNLLLIEGIDQPLNDWYLDQRLESSHMLRTFVDKNLRTVTHQLYLTQVDYKKWPGWIAAAGGDTLKLKVTRIDQIRSPRQCHTRLAADIASPRVQQGCLRKEIDAVDIPDSLLRARSAEGYSVTFLNKYDSLVVQLTGDQIRAQLRAVDSVVADLRR